MCPAYWPPALQIGNFSTIHIKSPICNKHFFLLWSCRCGALSVGDQILTIDDTVIENTALSPDEVMSLLDANTNKGYTQLQIMPSHAIARRGKNSHL